MINSLKEYSPNDFVKLTYKDNINNDFQFREGLNEDIYPLNTREECARGGFYFCRFKDVLQWFRRYQDCNLWRVKIPEGEKVIDYGSKLKARKIYLFNCIKFYEHPELCKLAVSVHPYSLEYVKTKTPLLCQIAYENRPNLIIKNYVKKFFDIDDFETI